MSARVREHAFVTPLTSWAAAADKCGTQILLKCEHQQKTGSFKVRGALAKLLSSRVVQAAALPTISDGTAGGIEEGSITLPLCTELGGGQPLVIVSCGANISSATLAGAIASGTSS